VRIIINADDLGISSAVNETTFDLMADGKITSATILANAPAVEDAVKRVPDFQNCSFGVHLNLTQFTPLTRHPALAPLCGRDGTFAGNVRSVRIDQGLRSAIFGEWCAQIEKLIRMGISLSHVDSHQHVHTIPVLLPVLKAVQKKFAIRKVRITKNIYGSRSVPAFSLLLQKRLWNLALRNYCRAVTAQGLTSFLEFCEVARTGALGCRTVELMTHPGAANSEVETTTLRDSWWADLPFETALINYKEL